MSNTPASAAPESLPAAPESAENGRTNPRTILIIVGVVILVVLVLAGAGYFVYWMYNHPENTRNIRDIFIVFLSLMSILVVLALVVLVGLLASLVIMLRNEIAPLLVSIRDTLSTIRGTTAFVSENVVSPVVRTASYVQGARRFVEVLAGLRPRRRHNHHP